VTAGYNLGVDECAIVLGLGVFGMSQLVGTQFAVDKEEAMIALDLVNREIRQAFAGSSVPHLLIFLSRSLLSPTREEAMRAVMLLLISGLYILLTVSSCGLGTIFLRRFHRIIGLLLSIC
jgi:hypothetical protein